MRTIFRNNYTPVMGEYHERYVIDEARHKSYLFDCDGVFNELPYVYVANEKGTSEEYAVSQKLFTDEVTKLADDIDYEAATRAAADTELGEAIDKETSDREDADTDLQNQIDLIKAASDVVDVVGTYADLQAYDTTKLNDNDIVKVLDDETRDDGITYYRWSTSTQTFTFVGALSAYYSKDETDTLLAGKQDTLTAGSNITISDNVISATDTTYTAGTNINIDSSNVISATLRPIYSSVGQNTDGAMTQKAITDMVYTTGYDPISDQLDNRVAIGGSVTNAGANSVVIGRGATASGPNAARVVIGNVAEAEGTQSIAIGSNARSNGSNTYGSVALGTNCNTYDSGSIAIGDSASASFGGIAIGKNSYSDENNTVSVGMDEYQTGGPLYRRIVNVADATTAHDAVTKSQLDAVAGNIPTINNVSSTDWSGLWQ